MSIKRSRIYHIWGDYYLQQHESSRQFYWNAIKQTPRKNTNQNKKLIKLQWTDRLLRKSTLIWNPPLKPKWQKSPTFPFDLESHVILYEGTKVK